MKWFLFPNLVLPAMGASADYESVDFSVEQTIALLTKRTLLIRYPENSNFVAAWLYDKGSEASGARAKEIEYEGSFTSNER